MDDFFEVLVFWFLIPFLVIIMIVGVIQMSSENGVKRERQDKRYELCLKQHKDWVDGNCVTPVK